jgi:hypothetical protein
MVLADELSARCVGIRPEFQASRGAGPGLAGETSAGPCTKLLAMALYLSSVDTATEAVPARASVEQVLELIGSLVRERQELRALGVSVSRLEFNRRRLVRAQRTLSTALIERHGQTAA